MTATTRQTRIQRLKSIVDRARASAPVRAILGHLRLVAYLVLAVVTVYGIYGFVTGSPGEAFDFWTNRWGILPIIIALACVDVALECLSWMLVCHRVGIRMWDRTAIGAFLTPRAGLLLPAQLGRLIRPDTLARLRRGSFGQCVACEGATFILDAISVLALLAALVAGALNPLLMPVAALLVIVPALFITGRLADTTLASRLPIPSSFWWSWSTIGIIAVQMAGWVAHGFALYLIIRGLADGVTAPASIFYAASSSVLGAGTGLPGGIGATEGLLFASLRLMSVPAEHLALAVGAFRLVTFWFWIPVGWVALMWSKRAATRLAEGDAPPAHDAETELKPLSPQVSAE